MAKVAGGGELGQLVVGNITGQVDGPVVVGENVVASVEGEDIVLRVRRSYRGGLSASGKTVRVGSTGGSRVFGGVVINLNVYVKP